MIPVALITSPTTQRRRATHGAGMPRLPAQSPRGAARCETCLSGSAVLSSYSSITRNPYPRSADECRRYLPFVITRIQISHDKRLTRGIVKIAKPTVEISDKVRLNLEKFV
jgi:hypothetical protein